MIETERLVLRPWREADKPAFVALVNTPAMMEHFGGVRDATEVAGLIDKQIASQDADGHSMWAVELRDGTLAGICGVRLGGWAGTPVPDELEVGWRIGEAFWGQGIAREAAEASIAWGWANTTRPRIAAWTNQGNAPSWGLMRRLGMARRPELDFAHPLYDPADPIGHMIVYALDRPEPA